MADVKYQSDLSHAELLDLEEKLKSEEAERKPLVGEITPISALMTQYANNKAYLHKLEHISTTVTEEYRPIRYA